VKRVDILENFLEELRSIERKWQNEWYSKGVFNANADLEKPKFFITVPYPYVSGPLHIGHGRTFTIADIIARFKRMIGYNVLFPVAWHITGTPIQSVADRISKNDEDAISLYKWYVKLYIDDENKVSEIVKTFSDGWNIVSFFSSVVEKDFRSIGLSMDFTRQFTTGDADYNAFIIWQYYKLREKGYIKQGSHAILYSPIEDQAVGEHDIKGGDELSISILEFNLIKFKIEDDDKYLVAATLRPETIYGVTNVWVKPEATYVIALVNGEKWIVSEKCIEKLKYQDKRVEILNKIRGEDLIGKFVISPLINRKVPILPADFVDDDTATGVVYSVPAHAPYDYIALIDLKKNEELLEKYGISSIVKNIEPIGIIEVKGFSEHPAKDIIEKLNIKSQKDYDKLSEATRIVYREEFYNGIMKSNTLFPGLKVEDARIKTIEKLMEINAFDRMYETEPRRIYTRAGNRVIVAIIKDQWFIDYSDNAWKKSALDWLSKMKIIPERYRKLFETTFQWLAYRPCARKRGIGTRLPWDPEWIIESLSDSTIYMAFYTIVKKLRIYELDKILERLKNRIIESKGADSDAVNKLLSFFDYIFLGKGDVKEVAKELGIDSEVLEDIRREFNYWYPVDQRHSGIDLITNHLSFFIWHHVGIFPEKYWPRAITLNEYVIREGMKMSRSLGNVLPLVDVPRKYSADLFRLYIAYAADLESVLDWRDEEVSKTALRLQRFWNITNQIISIGKYEKPPEELSIESKLLLSKINRIIKEIPELVDNMNLRVYVVKAFFELLTYVENYLEMIKILQTPSEEVKFTLWYVLDRWLRILQPVIPHICEELWHRMGNRTYISLERWPKIDEEFIDDELELAFEILERTIKDIREIMRVKHKKIGTIHLYVGPSIEMYDIVNEISRLIDKGEDVRTIIKTLTSKYKNFANKIPELVKKYIDGTIPRRIPRRDVELKVFKNFSKYIAHKVNVEEVIVQEATNPTYDPKNKAKIALPGRPGIYLVE